MVLPFCEVDYCIRRSDAAPSHRSDFGIIDATTSRSASGPYVGTHVLAGSARLNGSLEAVEPRFAGCMHTPELD